MEYLEEQLLYRQLLPKEGLKKHVRFFWYMEGPVPKTFDIVADGYPGIVFHQAEDAMTLEQNSSTRILPPVFLYGQTIQPIRLKTSGRFSMIGVNFFPHVTKSILGFNASQLTDTCVDLDLFPVSSQNSLTDRLLHSSLMEERITVLSNYIVDLLQRNNGDSENSMQFAIDQLIRSRGGISLKELHRVLQVSERTFERKFDQYVGVSPRLFSRICRFQSALQQLKKGNYQKLSDIAFDNGYADQSHFIRSFKEFTGYSPMEFQQQEYESAPH